MSNIKLNDDLIDITIFEFYQLAEKIENIRNCEGKELAADNAKECLRRASDAHAKALGDAGTIFRAHMRTIKQMLEES